MKKLYIPFLFCLSTVGISQEVPLYETITDNVPKIGITTEVYLGDRMLEQRTGDYRECIIPKQSYSKNYATNVWRINASQPLCKDSPDNEFYAANYHIIEACDDERKKQEMIEKIASGKLNKFISDNTLINQVWIMDPKKKVSDILKENSTNNKMEIKEFVRIKVGEGV